MELLIVATKRASSSAFRCVSTKERSSKSPSAVWEKEGPVSYRNASSSGLRLLAWLIRRATPRGVTRCCGGGADKWRRRRRSDAARDGLFPDGCCLAIQVLIAAH